MSNDTKALVERLRREYESWVTPDSLTTSHSLELLREAATALERAEAEGRWIEDVVLLLKTVNKTTESSWNDWLFRRDILLANAPADAGKDR